MKDVIKGLGLAGLLWVLLSGLGKYAYALDDFDLMKYGPKDTIEIGRTEVIVKLVSYTNQDRLNSAFNDMQKEPIPEGSGVRGFAVVSDSQDVCYIHIIPAEIWDDREAMAILGHELYHCFLSDHNAPPSVDETPNQEAAVSQEVLDHIEDLYAEDRRLELEWLKDDYEDMGIVIDE